MIVKDLIAKLSLLDPDLPVVIDTTPEHSELWRFATISEVEKIALDGKEECIAIFPYKPMINTDDLNFN